jgi:hypothetical protein
MQQQWMRSGKRKGGEDILWTASTRDKMYYGMVNPYPLFSVSVLLTCYGYPFQIAIFCGKGNQKSKIQK